MQMIKNNLVQQTTLRSASGHKHVVNCAPPPDFQRRMLRSSAHSINFTMNMNNMNIISAFFVACHVHVIMYLDEIGKK